MIRSIFPTHPTNDATISIDNTKASNISMSTIYPINIACPIQGNHKRDERYRQTRTKNKQHQKLTGDFSLSTPLFLL